MKMETTNDLIVKYLSWVMQISERRIRDFFQGKNTLSLKEMMWVDAVLSAIFQNTSSEDDLQMNEQKAIPMVPECYTVEGGRVLLYRCPTCKTQFNFPIPGATINYCYTCGQKLSWKQCAHVLEHAFPPADAPFIELREAWNLKQIGHIVEQKQARNIACKNALEDAIIQNQKNEKNGTIDTETILQTVGTCFSADVIEKVLALSVLTHVKLCSTGQLNIRKNTIKWAEQIDLVGEGYNYELPFLTIKPEVVNNLALCFRKKRHNEEKMSRMFTDAYLDCPLLNEFDRYDPATRRICYNGSVFQLHFDTEGKCQSVELLLSEKPDKA